MKLEACDDFELTALEQEHMALSGSENDQQNFTDEFLDTTSDQQFHISTLQSTRVMGEMQAFSGRGRGGRRGRPVCINMRIKSFMKL